MWIWQNGLWNDVSSDFLRPGYVIEYDYLGAYAPQSLNTILTHGVGSAVTRVDRLATFDGIEGDLVPMQRGVVMEKIHEDPPGRFVRGEDVLKAVSLGLVEAILEVRIGEVDEFLEGVVVFHVRIA